MLSIKVLDVPEIDKRVGSVILGKNPFDVMVPDYITAHLLYYMPSRILRASEDRQLVVIKTHTHYGGISFQVAAAKLWNASPFQLKRIQNIDSFKSKLKTYLFMLNL